MKRVDLASDGQPSGDTVATGFASLDRWLGGGVRRGDLVVLGGDVGSGKSALALAMALRMAQAGTSVAFLTGEMTAERVMERALAVEGRVRVDELRTGKLDDMARAGVGAAAVRLRDRPPRVEPLPTASLEAMRARVRELDCQVVVVDSLQSLALGQGPQDELLASAVRALKAAALDMDVTVLVTAQLTRWERGRPDPRPALDDFGALGAVKQHADVVLAIYREEMYAPGFGVEGATELLVRKNRNGTTGYVDLYFYKQWLRFEDMLDPDR
ncbi:AAA family ATPase [Pseudogemmatithrix spongiicola]|uniref:AAA family ATPase n=1 Tax=Pseudogemmatithrix spongiicola TaxID=3062599 RepID=A0AA49JSM7_9BACT|nr:AAA family ATPase [Gemmatimonadaceae bacterium 'strain 138']WKW14105.1 AAA family ATPase [Gemmatimonadaceae bacterium 'strain 318']